MGRSIIRFAFFYGIIYLINKINLVFKHGRCSMNLFEKMLYFLQEEMTEPVAFGWFHLMWLFFAITTIYIKKVLVKNN